MRPPGSDWLYLKLYGPAAGEDRCWRGPVRDLARSAAGRRRRRQLVLRSVLRSGAAPAAAAARRAGPADGSRAARALTVWAAGLIADGLRTRFTVETYEREVERYGGAAGMPLAETIFAPTALPSPALLAVLPSRRRTGRLDLAVAHASQALLSGLGDRRRPPAGVVRAAAPPPRTSPGRRIGSAKTGCAAAARRRPEARSDWTLEAATILRRLASEVAPAGARLAALHADGEVALPVDEIARSLRAPAREPARPGPSAGRPRDRPAAPQPGIAAGRSATPGAEPSSLQRAAPGDAGSSFSALSCLTASMSTAVRPVVVHAQLLLRGPIVDTRLGNTSATSCAMTPR